MACPSFHDLLYSVSYLRTWSLALLGFLMVSTGVQGALAEPTADTRRGDHHRSIPLPEGIPPERVQRALTYCISGRKWVIEEVRTGLVRASLNHRGIDAHLFVYTTDKEVEIRCEARDKKGRPTTPTRWLDYLHEDITQQLASAK
ncbi:MAG: hypothetical protein U1F61_30580 [Opitutaceae bacterium]